MDSSPVSLFGKLGLGVPAIHLSPVPARPHGITQVARWQAGDALGALAACLEAASNVSDTDQLPQEPLHQPRGLVWTRLGCL